MYSELEGLKNVYCVRKGFMLVESLGLKKSY